MATFSLRVEVDNAAFQDDPYELRRILSAVASLVPHEATGLESASGRIRDVNGNTVGSWDYDAKEE